MLFTLLAMTMLFLLSAPTEAYAACASPTGVAGEVVYDDGDSVMTYCDGTNWIEFPKVAGGSGAPSVTKIDSAKYGSCALLSDKTISCWGAASNGELGNGDSSSTKYPSPVQLGTAGTSTLWSDWEDVTMGGYGGCGIRSNGTAWCWGTNNFGRIGDNSTTTRNVPTQVGTAGTSTLFSDWVEIDTGGVHTCGIRSNGTAWCWGNNAFGQLGTGVASTSYVPVQVGTAGTSTLWNDWVDISVARENSGSGHTCGIRSNGTAWCWGKNSNGQLGTNSTTSSYVPVQVGTAGTSTLWSDWTVIESSVNNSCGIRSNGTAWCWGFGHTVSNIGNGSSASVYVPTQVGTAGTSTLFSDWAKIIMTSRGGCGVRDNGTAWCWGAVGNDGGGSPNSGLGDNSTNDSSVPVQVGTAGTSTLWSDWVDVSAYREDYYDYFCGVRSDGSAWCWGNNNYGQIGSGSSGGYYLIPTEVNSEDIFYVEASGTGSVKAGTSPYSRVVDFGDADTIITCIATLGTVTNVEADGVALELVNSITSSGVKTYMYALYDYTPSGNVTMNYYISGTATAAVKSILVNGLESTPFDQTARAGGISTTASTVYTGTTTADKELIIGCIGTNGPNDDNYGTWDLDFLNLDNNYLVGTSGQGAASNVSLSTAYKVVYSTGTYMAIKRDITSRDWAAVIGTFAIAAPQQEGYGSGCISPTGVAGMMLYDTGDDVMTYCNGSAWVEAGPNPGGGGAGCSSPSGTAGAMIYDTGDSVLTYCDGTNWVQIGK